MAAELIVLAGDVGGTNTRLGLAGPDIGVTGLRSFENQSFASLPDLVRAYVDQAQVPPLAGLCLAVAGAPGQGEGVALNRPWTGTKSDLRASVPLTENGRVDIVNDLVGLGLALPVLMPGQLASLRPGRQVGEQALVVGVGTGFNVSVSIGARAVSAELGQGSLPAPVVRALHSLLKGKTAAFSRIEDLFSGPGLVRFHQALSGEMVGAGAEIVAGYVDQTCPRATRTVTEWARLLGLFVRELCPAYLPGQGVFLAGSVARAVLGSEARAGFLEAVAEPLGPLDGVAKDIPLWLITDDAAGVSGSARRALEQAGG